MNIKSAKSLKTKVIIRSPHNVIKPYFCRMIKQIYNILFLLILITTSSCEPTKQAISLDKSFSKDIWNSLDIIDFKTLIPDTETPYQVKVVVVLSEKFSENNFGFVLSQKSEEGESIYSHYQIPIRSKEGVMEGKLEGEFYYYTIIVNKKTYFNSKGEYTFSFESTMNKLKIKGVHKITLEINPL